MVHKNGSCRWRYVNLFMWLGSFAWESKVLTFLFYRSLPHAWACSLVWILCYKGRALACNKIMKA